MTEPTTAICSTISGSRSRGTLRPVVMPVTTTVPPRATWPRLCAHVAVPTLSHTASAFPGSGAFVAKTLCAPSFSARAMPRRLRLVAQTVSPAARASWMSAVDMPPLAPCTSTVWPGSSRALPKSAR